MKKIGIITIPDYDNYGNRLQNFAVKKFFSAMGYTVDTLELNDTEFSQYQMRRIKLLLKKYRLRLLVYLFEFASGKFGKVKRYRKFEKFTDKYLDVKYHPIGEFRSLKKIEKAYDYIVLGSDQIWHPTVNTTPNLFFATFVDRKKVLFFAPSFGVDQLPSKYAELVKHCLAGKDNLTVREKSGQKIIHELLGEEAVVLPDPTLCIDPLVWENMAVPFKNIGGKPYILKYFLGSENEDYKLEFDRICCKYNAEIVELANVDKKCGYTTGPQEFLGGIQNAEYVITDSFHAVVFCIIFRKPFTVFSRQNEKNETEGLDSRIDTLLEEFSIQNRKFNPDITNEIGNIDSSDFQKILDVMRGNTIDFFRKIMNS